MSCTVAVSGATINPVTGNLTIQGTISFAGQGCGGNPIIDIKIQCESESHGVKGYLIPGSLTDWEATFPAQCTCDFPLSGGVGVICPGPPQFSCGTPFTIQNLCCCPQITTQVTVGLCSANTQLFTFNTTVVNNTSCAFTVRRNFGDGFFGNVFSIGPYTTQYLTPEPHNYAAPSNYTSFVDVLSPPPFSACAGSDPVTVNASCGNCYSTPLVASLCRFLELLFLFSLTAALSIGFSQPCVPAAVGAVFAAIALLALLFYVILQCQKCTCDFILNYFGVVLIATGFVNVMFIWPGCAAITGFAAFIDSLILWTLGFLVLGFWYTSNKLTCPLLICDFWCAVSGIQSTHSATAIAILVIFLIFSFNVVALAGGWVLALFVATSFAVYIWFYGPLSQPPCKHSPTCQ